MGTGTLEIRWLGRMEYEKALHLQQTRVAGVAEGRAGETLYFMEHDPVYTIGRTRNRESLVDESQLPHPLHTIHRGGQATYHGPGQLMGYPILNLGQRGRDLHRYLRTLEQILIELLSRFGVQGTRREGLTGVWVENRKIAAIGVGVRRWISYHGFALNVGPDLDPFQAIVPCGIQDVRVTSLSRELGRRLEVESCAEVARGIFHQRLEQLLPLDRVSSTEPADG